MTLQRAQHKCTTLLGGGTVVSALDRSLSNLTEVKPLLTPDEVLHGNHADISGFFTDREWAALHRMSTYVCRVLTNTNEDLGRPGPVCPFTPSALRLKMLKLTVSPLSSDDEPALSELLDRMRKNILDADAAAGLASSETYRSIIVVFPYLSMPEGADFINRIQKSLKYSYVKSGLMLGEFYPGCPVPGLYNPHFQPQDTPEVCLAIRHITVSDGPFMVNDRQCMQSFYERFGMEARKRVNALMERNLPMSPECRSFVLLSEGA